MLDELEKYVNRKINDLVELEEESKRYEKAHINGSLCALKDIQNKIIMFKKELKGEKE